MNGEKELFSEDFEIVTQSSFRSPDTETATAGEGAVIDDQTASRDDTLSSHLSTSAVNGTGHTFDPYQTFELIHHEHQALKEELITQQDLLVKQRSALEIQKNKHTKELADLKEQVTMLKIDVSEKDQRLTELENQVKVFKESSEKADELAAKLCAAEDQIKYFEQAVRQFQSDGFVSVQPPMLTDALLAKELKDKEEHLEQLRSALVEKESSQIGLAEENAKLKEDIDTLRNLIVVMQTQLDNDQIDMEHIRSDYEKRINSLNQEVAQYLQSRSQQRQRSPPKPTADSNVQQLSHTDMHERVYECQRCKLRIRNEELFKKHTERCPSIIENID